MAQDITPPKETDGGGIFEEWKKASPKEKMLILGAIAAVLLLMVYIHNKSQGQANTVNRGAATTSGGGTVVNTGPTGVTGAPGKPGPTGPTGAPGPTGKPAAPTKPVYAHPVTTVGKTMVGRTPTATSYVPGVNHPAQVQSQMGYIQRQVYGTNTFNVGGGAKVPYKTGPFPTTSGMGQGNAAVSAGGQQTSSGILRWYRGY